MAFCVASPRAGFELEEILQKKELTHEDICNVDVVILIKKYGEKKAMEVLREHLLIEINALRKENAL